MGNEQYNNCEYKIADLKGDYKSYKDFSTLDCWKYTQKVKLFFYNEIFPTLPKDEKYNLGSQLRNASISITANIAEGYGRFHFKESIQFYRISRGSLFELKDHLISCLDLKYITESLYDKGILLIETAIKILNGYINYMQKNINNFKS